MTIGFCTQHLIIGKLTFVLAVTIKFETTNYTVGVNCA